MWNSPHVKKLSSLFFFLKLALLFPYSIIPWIAPPSSLPSNLDKGIIFHIHPHMQLVGDGWRFYLKYAFWMEPFCLITSEKPLLFFTHSTGTFPNCSLNQHFLAHSILHFASRVTILNDKPHYYPPPQNTFSGFPLPTRWSSDHVGLHPSPLTTNLFWLISKNSSLPILTLDIQHFCYSRMWHRIPTCRALHTSSPVPGTQLSNSSSNARHCAMHRAQW